MLRALRFHSAGWRNGVPEAAGFNYYFSASVLFDGVIVQHG